MDIVFSSLLGYLIGSIPFALVIGKVFYKVDVRQHGSGNLGGSNAGRTLGAKAGAIVSVLDVLKATVAMTITYFLFPSAVIAGGFFATLGHCFPVFAGFKGGKAVSTAIGFLLGITLFITHRPVVHFMVPLLVFFGVLFLKKMVSLAAISAVSSAALILFVTEHISSVSILFAIIALIVIVRHKDNIQRIITKTERKISWL